MNARTRTTLGILLFVPLSVVLLASYACLPAPVGEPEKSAVDAKLTGAWQAVKKEGEDADSRIALMRPWDAHTYYLQYMATEKGKDKTSVMHFKAWLTK